MNSVVINDLKYNFKGDFTIYQFCFSKGIVLPCFCYHEKLSIAGNCRVCLVEANGALVVSCAMPLVKDMVISTDSTRVRRSREGVVEFLLINHPLDCPICDQGGECDLQDISFVFGSDRGRFYEKSKRSVDNLNCCGPLIKTVMTRCIHCTRCVRFLNEISGVFDLGVLGRGSAMEIGTFLENHWDHELSGNIIDLCPVGALTSMPYAFVARPWDLQSIESIDVLDALASSIRVDVANNKVLRILPALSEAINEEWITNKARFSYDAFLLQRSYYPRFKVSSNFIVVSWGVALATFLDALVFGCFGFLEATVGPFLDLEGVSGLRALFHGVGCSNINYEAHGGCFFDYRFNFLLASTLSSLESLELCLFFGLNLRMEAPLLNSRLRKSFLAGNHPFFCFSFGGSLDYVNFPIFNLGNTMGSLKSFLEGRQRIWANFIFNAVSVMVKAVHLPFLAFSKCALFLGGSLFKRTDGNFVSNALGHFLQYQGRAFCFNWNVISPFLGRIASLELGALPGIHSSTLTFVSRCKGSFLYLLGTEASAFDGYREDFFQSSNFVVYQGSFFEDSTFFSFVNLMLPVALYSERVSSYINVEGRLRRTTLAITPFNLVTTDLEILQALIYYKYSFFPRNFSLAPSFSFFMRFFSTVIDYSCLFFFNLTENTFKHFFGDKLVAFDDTSVLFLNYKNFKFFNTLLVRNFNHYYGSEQFSRNSKIMSLCFMKSKIFSFYKEGRSSF